MSGAPNAALVDRSLEALRADGQRITTARRAVIELLASTSEHLNAEQVAPRVRRAHPSVHVSTVYRTLESLARLGLVDHVHPGHGAAFFHLARSHQHLVCEQCGAVSDVPID